MVVVASICFKSIIIISHDCFNLLLLPTSSAVKLPQEVLALEGARLFFLNLLQLGVKPVAHEALKLFPQFSDRVCQSIKWFDLVCLSIRLHHSATHRVLGSLSHLLKFSLWFLTQELGVGIYRLLLLGILSWRLIGWITKVSGRVKGLFRLI